TAPPPSGLAIPLVEHVPHDRSDDLGQVPAQVVELPLEAVELTLEAIELLLDPIESGFDRRQIVAVAACLLENMASDQLLAFNLAFQRNELFSGDLGRHPGRTPSACSKPITGGEIFQGLGGGGGERLSGWASIATLDVHLGVEAYRLAIFL